MLHSRLPGGGVLCPPPRVPISKLAEVFFELLIEYASIIEYMKVQSLQSCRYSCDKKSYKIILNY